MKDPIPSPPYPSQTMLTLTPLPPPAPPTTYLTVLLQSLSPPPSPSTLTPNFEPGAQDTTISEYYLEAIENAMQRLPLLGSETESQKLEERHQYIMAAQEDQRFSRFMGGPYGR